MEPVEQPTIGERIKAARQRRHLTRPVVAGQLGMSTEWLKAIETGKRQPPRLPMLVNIARVLRISDLSELTGTQALPIVSLAATGHPATPAVARALMSYPYAATREPLPLPALRRRVLDAWRTRHASPDHRTALGALLPDLITEAQYAVRTYDGPDRRAAAVHLSEVYALAQFFLAYQPDSRLTWLVADRGMLMAQDADDPVAIGFGAWALSQVLRESGEAEQAEAVTTEALSVLRDHRDSPEALGIYGSLTFDAGLTAAALADFGGAWRSWDAAQHIADQLSPDYYHRMTSFSQVIMDVHAVSLSVELGQPREAIRKAETFDPLTIPSRPRRARHLIEVARAYHGDRQRVAAVHLLLRAYDTAPETIRFNSYAREISADLLRSGGSSIREEAADLAAKLEVAI
jgi:transcriptional regulator with XRE-family HTH domain